MDTLKMANAALIVNGVVANVISVNVDVQGKVVGYVPDSGVTLGVRQTASKGDSYAGGVFTSPPQPVIPPQPITSVLSQDLMAQFTVGDYTAIVAAVAATPAFGLLWVSLQAQKDPMIIANARFKAGWAALVQVLGQPRM